MSTSVPRQFGSIDEPQTYSALWMTGCVMRRHVRDGKFQVSCFLCLGGCELLIPSHCYKFVKLLLLHTGKMKLTSTTLCLTAGLATCMADSERPVIDREKIVRAFNPRRTASSEETPLQVGNGDFAFGVDVTGLQTFKPFATLSNWGWHEFPLPTTSGQTSPAGESSCRAWRKGEEDAKRTCSSAF